MAHGCEKHHWGPRCPFILSADVGGVTRPGPSVPLCGCRHQLSEARLCLRALPARRGGRRGRTATQAFNSNVVGVTTGPWCMRPCSREGQGGPAFLGVSRGRGAEGEGEGSQTETEESARAELGSGRGQELRCGNALQRGGARGPEGAEARGQGQRSPRWQPGSTASRVRGHQWGPWAAPPRWLQMGRWPSLPATSDSL